ncbi:MAG TPA: hypothetical protein DDY89_20810 [Lysinibacillus sp.]|nr:hypothetical protein [Lysinibacillus sp.]
MKSCLAILSHFANPEIPEMVNAKLVNMCVYLKMLDGLNNLVEVGASEREIKSFRSTLKILLL